MKQANPVSIQRKDYQPPAYYIDTTILHVSIYADDAVVRSRLSMRRGDHVGANTPLRLDGEQLALERIAIDGRELATSEYRLDGDSLEIASVPARFELEIVTRVKPRANKSMTGLYRSRTMFCTQCEAQGFRRITYYLDRPDVLARFTTTVEADRSECPVLLSNGNPVGRGELPENRHWVTWQDPFPKPSYLFALVAGSLHLRESSFTTCSGRQVALRFFVEEKDLDKCDHAMASLKNAMRWDEQVYGREYDLDIYMIVAVDDFNMGAMENKGLNIFNTACVLAHPQTTTDAGFQSVEAIVGHEYFHNWSGNRVTCRDWFQLSLKEGFTVFRDAEFSADMGSRTVKRVEDVSFLRSQQFAEDAGPMAHPVRPDYYIEINNFYTVTVYEKGAEVVRMLAQLLGPELFRKGTDLYFERHDGKAVTCDDFVAAMAEVSGRDLTLFKRWYSQAGTPVLTASSEYDASARRFILHLQQSCPATPGQTEKLPFLIPVRMALLGAAGSLPLQLNAADEARHEITLEFDRAEQSYVFENIEELPIPSLLRSFSAPVRLKYNYSPDQLLLLMRNDDDGFNRWDACQNLSVQILQELIAAVLARKELRLSEQLLSAYSSLLENKNLDPAMVALMLNLPSESYLAEESSVVYPHIIHQVREFSCTQIALALQSQLLETYHRCAIDAAYAADGAQTGKRALRNTCLAYLARLPQDTSAGLAQSQLSAATNMTDRIAALISLTHFQLVDEIRKSQLLADFYRDWQHESLVVNQWLQIQASNPLPGALTRVTELMQHPGFDADNPNKLRALVGAFVNANAVNFHADDGSGYQFLADVVMRLNASNPQIASRLVTPLTRWKKYPSALAGKMCDQLKRILAAPSLSPDIYEVVSKSLA